MRKLWSGVYWEPNYDGVQVGAVVGDEAVALIDCPLRAEEAREWAAQAAELGPVRYLVLLDKHPDRSLGARHLPVAVVGHILTCEAMTGWPDTFRGQNNPIGAAADNLNRAGGVAKAIPEVIFQDKLTIELGGKTLVLQHHPGPTAGAIWALIPDQGIVFIGDAVTTTEPPYLGEADIEAWLEGLDLLRESEFEDWKYISSRDGPIERDDINDMARFIRKVPVRLDRMSEREDPAASAGTFANELMGDFRVTKSREELCHLRLTSGLRALYKRANPGFGSE